MCGTSNVAAMPTSWSKTVWQWKMCGTSNLSLRKPQKTKTVWQWKMCGTSNPSLNFKMKFLLSDNEKCVVHPTELSKKRLDEYCLTMKNVWYIHTNIKVCHYDDRYCRSLYCCLAMTKWKRKSALELSRSVTWEFILHKLPRIKHELPYGKSLMPLKSVELFIQRCP